jgi:hypothetical protein
MVEGARSLVFRVSVYDYVHRRELKGVFRFRKWVMAYGQGTVFQVGFIRSISWRSLGWMVPSRAVYQS